MVLKQTAYLALVGTTTELEQSPVKIKGCSGAISQFTVAKSSSGTKSASIFGRQQQTKDTACVNIGLDLKTFLFRDHLYFKIGIVGRGFYDKVFQPITQL